MENEKIIELDKKFMALTTLFDIEQGLRIPLLETLHRICIIFKIPMEYITNLAIVKNIYDIPIKRKIIVKMK